jgi:hypothetical protein
MEAMVDDSFAAAETTKVILKEKTFSRFARLKQKL